MDRSRAVAALLNRIARLRVAGPLARAQARLYRLTRGRVLGRWFGGPVLVLEVIGRKTGRRRSTPLVYLRHGDGYVVIAANAGSEATPAWWLNLRDAGRGTIYVDGTRREVRPRETDGPERARLYRSFVRSQPSSGFYEGYADRRLPVVVLEPADPAR